MASLPARSQAGKNALDGEMSGADHAVGRAIVERYAVAIDQVAVVKMTWPKKPSARRESAVP